MRNLATEKGNVRQEGVNTDGAGRVLAKAKLMLRKDKPRPNTATARKLTILVYRALKEELVYRDPRADAYNLQQRTRLMRHLRERAATLGFSLVNRETSEILESAIS